MLTHAARTLPHFVRASLGSKALVSRIHRRVRVSETDFNLHMNQAAYAQVAELGRTDLVLRSGLARRLWKARVKPVVAEQRLVYRRELRPRQRYVLDSRATGLDGRLLTIDAYLLVGDRVHAAVYAKLISIGSAGVLDAEAAAALFAPYLTEALSIEDWRVVA